MMRHFIKYESIIFGAEINHQVEKHKLKGGHLKYNLNSSSPLSTLLFTF